MKGETMQNIKKTRWIAVIGIMSAVAAALQFLEFPIPLVPAFIKFDFSDLPGLITAFAFGPLAGILVSLMKNLIHLLITQSGGVGELANFLIAAIFTGAAGLVYKFNKSRIGALIASLAGSFCAALASVAVNYFIIYPIYYKIAMPQEAILGMYQAILPSVDSIFKSLLIFNLPFTFVKCLIISLICFFIYKKLSPILKHSKEQRAVKNS
ncbi:MAG: ECF transporter S component [Ruminococcaceae bacterium]|nr:ECF transporter S component [Oscillospiraceae bacterium]